MSGGWIAGDVRARGLAAADVLDIADRVAATPDLVSACTLLGQTKWGHRIGEARTVGAAQRMVFDALLWQMRILAGWLPSEGVEAVRCCLLWFEIRNIEDRLAYFGGAPAEAPYDLGRLGIISKALAGTSSPSDIRQLMRASAWGDASGDDVYAIRMALRRAWYRRVRAASPELRTWADAAAWLFASRERLARRTGGTALAATPPSLPSTWSWATTVSWSEQNLWHAEERWWEQVRDEGARLLHGSTGSKEPVLGAMATLASSAHRIATALEIAEGGGTLERLDAGV
jgi:hypothetical protein